MLYLFLLPCRCNSCTMLQEKTVFRKVVNQESLHCLMCNGVLSALFHLLQLTENVIINPEPWTLMVRVVNSTQPPGLLSASLYNVWPKCCLCYRTSLCSSRLVLPSSNTLRLLRRASEAHRSPASSNIRPSPRFLTGSDEGCQTRAPLTSTDDPQKNRGNGP